MENLLENLNEEQVAAVTHREGPLMIIAGAGTGKTTVITHRIGWLIEQRLAAPENILALTFTEKAAAEMEERVDLLLPYGYVDLQISTFHAFCERVLRDDGAEIGLSRNFLMLSELDAWLLAREHFDRFTLDYYRPLGNPTKYLKTLLSHFSRAKDEMITPDEYVTFAQMQAANADSTQSNEETTSEAQRLNELANAYHTYQQILREADALDFGDLITYTLHLLQKRPRVLSALRERFRFVLVDEFQDTNSAQYALIKLIAAPRNNLTIVGDDDQSIYKFRGASLSNILQFERDYPGSSRVVLTKNYRSGQRILDQAHAFIQQNNPHRLESLVRENAPPLNKKLTSERDLAGEVCHLHFATLEEEVSGVIEKMRSLREQFPEASWSDFGILVRANRSAEAFVDAFDRRGIPYQFMALSGLYGKPAILDILALLRVIDNPSHSPSLYRLLCHPLFVISARDVATLTHEAKKKGTSLFDICRMARATPGISEQAAASIERMLSIIEKCMHEAKTRRASEMMVIAAKTGGLIDYANGLSDGAKEEAFRFLRQFYDRVKRFEARHDDRHLHRFLEEFQQERDAGEEGALLSDAEEGPDVVRLMTVHGAKGLEFRFVFVVNVVDRRFPTNERKEAIELPESLVKETLPEGDVHLEEERRLFYVAMTRAKDALFFTSADDYGGSRKKKPSRFLMELGIEPTKNNTKDPLVFGEETAVPPGSETMVFELPKQLSFTQLRAFSTCPLQYKFAHVLKIPVFESWSLSYGKTMHNTMQEWLGRWMERAEKKQAGLFADAPAESESALVSCEEVLQIYQEQWIDDWYPDNKLREEYRAKGRASLKTYHAMLQQTPPQPIALEQAFTCKIGPVTIKGRIDRIDAADGGIEIIDYKTGTPKQKLDADDREQLLLYQIAAEEILQKKPMKLTYHYLDDHSEQSFLGTPDELVHLKDNILDIVSRMKASSFQATPGFWCRFCDFRDICEFRQNE